MGASGSTSSSNQESDYAWPLKLYFDPEADKPLHQEYRLSDIELLSEVTSQTKSSTRLHIIQVKVYMAAHTDAAKDLNNERFEHIFLVVGVEDGNWFSLEIDDGGIAIQRSKSIDGLTRFCRDKFRTLFLDKQQRPAPKQVFEQPKNSKKITLGELLEWLHAKLHIWRRRSDCYHFASQVFNHITETTLNIPKPAHVCGILKPNDKSEYEAYFTPDVDEKISGSNYMITEDQLLEDNVASEEKIKNVWAYKTPLSERQLAFVLFYHVFIVFETDSWWWSIEKAPEGVTIQRTLQSTALKNNYRKKPRIMTYPDYWKITEMNHDTGTKTMKQLIHWLKNEQKLFRPYHMTQSNSQQFGKAVFDFVAKDRTLKTAT